jgi:hypothetical protein
MRRTVLALLTGALLIVGTVACDDTAGTTEPTSEDSPDITLDGEPVTVSGTVDEVVAGQAFTMTDATVEEGTATIDGDLAVLVTDEDADVSPSDQVVVTGTLHQLDLADEAQELEDLLGVSLDDDVIAQLEGRDVLLASSVDTSA